MREMLGGVQHLVHTPLLNKAPKDQYALIEQSHKYTLIEKSHCLLIFIYQVLMYV